MKKFALLALAFVFLSVICASGFAAEVLVFKACCDTVPSHPEFKFLEKLAELVKQKTDGRVVIQAFANNQLGTSNERLQGLRDGTVEITSNSLGHFAGYDPLMGIFEAPYLFTSDEHQYKVFHGEVGKQINERLKPHGFFIFSYLEVGARNITNSKRPIYTPGDLQGLKLRVPDTKSSINALTALGAKATPMAFAEVYMALQQKVVDGQENPLPNIYNGKLYEVQKYLSLTGHQRLEQTMSIGLVAWNKMTTQDQEAFMQAASEAKVYAQELFKHALSSLVGELKKNGMDVNEVEVTPFIPLAKQVKDNYVTEFGNEAKAFFDAIDALR